ncbi:nuclear transport factor 2 family protein [Dyadobacter sp. CY261]|uniref:nuclear transport factor 2 family protein n=1 Tax=Dyadobacter sp. CY261 TaxID=2907203 RepID=UPI001F2DF419|nr:nuclear transport factor 2 family protein [Dyadobacter sp. CY261]MCF0069373.1 nuclear transport factor 2 family protein [Dyadobacter sp. CY261]
MENSAKLLEHSLLVIWNDRNAERRLQAMENIYADDMAFYESNEGPAIVGNQAINDLISKLQQQWPLEFEFQLNGPASINHHVQHVAWNLGIPGQAPEATGMDIAIIKDGKIKSLHLFLNLPPA